jgi:ATP-dependent Clp endopeptidase proteolytic subunit ClpP
MKPEAFKIVCKADEAEVTIYDVIDRWFGVSPTAVRDALKDAGEVKTIRVRINSPGGNIVDGTAIYNILKSHKAKKIAVIDGVAASMASVVAMAGDEIEMGEGAYMMIHNPLGVVWGGEADDMREMADLLDKMKGQLVGIYERRTGMDAAEISQMMDEETWMTAEEAIENGFADRTVPSLKLAASVDVSQFQNAPKELMQKPKRTRRKAAEPKAETPVDLIDTGEPNMADSQTTPQPATYHELKAAFPKAKADFLTSQLDANATLDQARNAYQTMLEQQAADAQAKIAEAEAKVAAEAKARAEAEAKAEEAAKAATTRPGVAPVGTSGAPAASGDEDPITTWNTILAGYAREGMKEGKAISRAIREYPEAHRQYLLAYNQANGRKLRGRYANE